MVAGQGLLPLLCLLALLHVISALSPYEGGKVENARLRRSSPYFDGKFNTSYGYEDLMLEDEADSGGGGIQEKVVVRGQVVMLECLEKDKRVKFQHKIKDTHADAAVRWFHEDKEVKPDLRVTWSVIGRLRVSHAVSGDSGVWRCKKDGYFRRPLRLIVTIPPERPFLVYGGAQLAEGARLTIRASYPLNLHCVVNGGNPAPTVEWFLNEKDVTGNSSFRSDWKNSNDQFASMSNVTIKKILKSHHNASVVCRVVHPALSRPLTTHLKLNVQYHPDFRLRREPSWGSPLREGSSMSVLCLVDSNPPSEPYWIKKKDGEEVVLVSDGWLNLTSVTASHKGWYKCSTNHLFGHYSSHSVFINVLPQRKSLKSSEARVGASRLGMSSSGQLNHKSSYTGQATSTDLLGADPCTSSSGSSTLCWHTSFPQENESEGPLTQQYPLRQREEPLPAGHAPHCPSYSDEKGSDKNKDYIWRSDIKIKVMNRTHTTLEGGSVILTAHICGSPVVADQVTWIPPSKKAALTPGYAWNRWSAFNLSSPDSQKCVLSNLHIVPVLSEEDLGSWVILVVSSEAAHAAVVHLNVTAAAAKSLAAATLDAESSSVATHCWAYPAAFMVPLVFSLIVSSFR